MAPRRGPMRVYTQNVPHVAGEGFVARLQFTRQVSDVVVSAAFVHKERALPAAARLYVQTLARDGTLVDSVPLVRNATGGAQVGLHVLGAGTGARFQVVVLAYGADVIRGSLTAMHGLTDEASALLTASLRASGVPTSPPATQEEVAAPGGCPVPSAARRDIEPFLTRPAFASGRAFGVVPAPAMSCGGVQILP